MNPEIEGRVDALERTVDLLVSLHAPQMNGMIVLRVGEQALRACLVKQCRRTKRWCVMYVESGELDMVSAEDVAAAQGRGRASHA